MDTNLTLPKDLIFPSSILRARPKNLIDNITDNYTDTDTIICNDKEDHLDYAQIEDMLKIHEKYQTKSQRKNTLIKKLNKTKVYFIAKSMNIEDDKMIVAVPINNFDDLTMTGDNQMIISRSMIFQFKTAMDLSYDIEGMPGNRPYIFPYIVKFAEGPYRACRKVLRLKDLDIVEGKEIPDEPDPNNEKYWEKDGILREDYGLSHYDIEQAFHTTPKHYSIDPRDLQNFTKTWKDYVRNFKDLNFNDLISKKKEVVPDRDKLGSIVKKNTVESQSKHIIPVFSNLEEAQHLLLTVFEELMEPYKTPTRRLPDLDLKNIDYTNVDYLDMPLIHADNTNIPTTKLEKILDPISRLDRLKYPVRTINSFKSLLAKYRLIKSNTELKPHLKNYGWDCDISLKNPKKYQQALNIKIIKMGLGDFLTFWNNKEIKHGEVLFLPSTQTSSKLKLLSFDKNPDDKFYQYQHKFQRRAKRQTDDYIYEIK